MSYYDGPVKVVRYPTMRAVLASFVRPMLRPGEKPEDLRIGGIDGSGKEIPFAEASRSHGEVFRGWAYTCTKSVRRCHAPRSVHLWAHRGMVRLNLISMLAHELAHARGLDQLIKSSYRRDEEWRADRYGQVAAEAFVLAQRLRASPARRRLTTRPPPLKLVRVPR